MMRISLTVCAIAFFLATPVAHAQFGLPTIERQLTLVANPEYPGPHETVHLSLEGFALDFDRSTIIWYVNDQEFARGADLTAIDVVMGDVGTVREIVVSAADDSGRGGSAHATLRPTEVDLLWDTDAFVPPLYRGRALAGSNATIHAQAVVNFARTNGTRIPTSDIIFTWYKGNTRIDGGRGKDRITVPGPLLFGTDTLSVIAESRDGLYHGRAAATITAHDPTIELYEYHPLFGALFHRAFVGEVATAETEQQVIAVPYFAPAQSAQDPTLMYDWVVDGTHIEPKPDAPHILTLWRTEDYEALTTIELSITSLADIFMQSHGTWTLAFQSTFGSLFTGGNPFTRTTE